MSAAGEPRLLNVGCGRHFHPAWRNIDMVSYDPQVEAHDLRLGLPADDNQYDLVYHSHVLEHLSPSDGQRLIRQCARVLKPGGILRIVVPDLEQITRLYLQALEEAWHHPADPWPQAKYDWLKLELIDQMVRHTSGGAMGPMMQQARGQLAELIAQRLGHEVTYTAASPPRPDSTNTGSTRPCNKRGLTLWRACNHLGQTGMTGEGQTPFGAEPHTKSTGRVAWRERWARKLLKWLLGRSAVQQLELGRFLDSGEVHRWMYDRVSLRALTQACGLVDFTLRSAEDSYYPNFDQFQLDRIGSQIRKPDSIFCECRKR